MKKIQLFMTLFIIFLMVSSIIGFLFPYGDSLAGPANGNLVFNGVEFLPTQDQRWIALNKDKQYIFDHLPSELSEITFPYNPAEEDKVYVVYNPSELTQATEYLTQKTAYNLQLEGKEAILACTTLEGCNQFTVQDCTKSAIYLKTNLEKESVFKDQNCLVIEGDTFYQSKVIDKIIQKTIGIE